jgi:hypothetical protein
MNPKIELRIMFLDLVERYRKEKKVPFIMAFEICGAWAHPHFGVIFPSYPSLRNFKRRNRDTVPSECDTEIREIFSDCEILPVFRAIVEDTCGVTVQQRDTDGRKKTRLNDDEMYVREEERRAIETLRVMIEAYEKKRPHKSLEQIQAEVARRRAKCRRDFQQELSGR